MVGAQLGTLLLLFYCLCMPRVCECAYINVLCGDIHVCVCVCGGGGGEKVDVNKVDKG